MITKEEHKLLALWAAAQAMKVLPFFRKGISKRQTP